MTLTPQYFPFLITLFRYYTISLLLYFTSYFPDSFKRTIALAREALET